MSTPYPLDPAWLEVYSDLQVSAGPRVAPWFSWLREYFLAHQCSGSITILTNRRLSAVSSQSRGPRFLLDSLRLDEHHVLPKSSSLFLSNLDAALGKTEILFLHWGKKELLRIRIWESAGCPWLCILGRPLFRLSKMSSCGCYVCRNDLEILNRARLHIFFYFCYHPRPCTYRISVHPCSFDLKASC